VAAVDMYCAKVNKKPAAGRKMAAVPNVAREGCTTFACRVTSGWNRRPTRNGTSPAAFFAQNAFALAKTLSRCRCLKAAPVAATLVRRQPEQAASSHNLLRVPRRGRFVAALCAAWTPSGQFGGSCWVHPGHNRSHCGGVAGGVPPNQPAAYPMTSNTTITTATPYLSLKCIAASCHLHHVLARRRIL
jgi:hypothetical protein